MSIMQLHQEDFQAVFDLETVCAQHPAVMEVAVVASPDLEQGSVWKAFITLKNDILASEDLVGEIKGFVQSRLADLHLARVEFVRELPKTRSGKTRKEILRQMERERFSRHQQAASQ